MKKKSRTLFYVSMADSSFSLLADSFYELRGVKRTHSDLIYGVLEYGRISFANKHVIQFEVKLKRR